MKKILLILCISVFSCKTDNLQRGNIDGVWTSDKYSVEIRGNCGFLTELSYTQEITGDIPLIGDTVIKHLIKVKGSNKEDKFEGLRIFLQPETNELQWDAATFSIIEKDDALIMTSIINGKDTIFFKN